ncbi:hypothetical protein DSO57_1022933 [Entomophthora muscae]|uniref:Uncharacterized protein n=1 Tax=Entomophthora muscae TaxID=34485 RepID=A0ACC2UNU6_9FUNG|nr:hypothetical protein DSO57_1022933 [Entomophthora muscae]
MFVGLKRSRDMADKILRDIDNEVSPHSSKSYHELNRETFMNDISILELNPSPQELPCVNQGRQEPARPTVGPNPRLPEMLCPDHERQEPVSLLSIETESSISTLETPESNPDPPKAN